MVKINIPIFGKMHPGRYPRPAGSGTTEPGCIIAGVNIVYLILFYYNFCRRHYETIES